MYYIIFQSDCKAVFKCVLKESEKRLDKVQEHVYNSLGIRTQHGKDIKMNGEKKYLSLKILCLILGALLLFSAFGCASETGKETATSGEVTTPEALIPDGSATVATQPETEPEKPGLAAPDEKFDCDFTIASGYVTETKYTTNLITAQEYNGDIINDAIVKRTIDLEENLGVRIIVEDVGYQQIINVSKSGDRPHDIGTATLSEIMNVVNAGVTVNLRDVDSCGLDNPWWDGNANQKFRIGDNLYYTLSDFFITGIDNARAVYFSKDLAEDLRLGSLYELVDKNEWTIEKMQELSMVALASDGSRYGIVNNATTFYEVMLTGCDEEIVKIADDGIPYFATAEETDRFIDVYTKLLDLFSKEGQYLITATDTGRQMFMENKSLFTTDTMFLCSHLRMNSTNDFGIMPVPKFDADQERYLHVSPNPDVFFILDSADNGLIDRCGSILNYASYYSSQYYSDKALMPCYFDLAITTRSAPDLESSGNLQIVHDNISYVIKIVGTSFSSAIYSKFKEADYNIGSFLKSGNPQQLKALEKVLDGLGIKK